MQGISKSKSKKKLLKNEKICPEKKKNAKCAKKNEIFTYFNTFTETFCFLFRINGCVSCYRILLFLVVYFLMAGSVSNTGPVLFFI